MIFEPVNLPVVIFQAVYWFAFGDHRRLLDWAIPLNVTIAVTLAVVGLARVANANDNAAHTWDLKMPVPGLRLYLG